MSVTLLVGTVKGAFRITSDDRVTWAVEGPLFKGWKVTTSARHEGRTVVATASDVYGVALHVSEDGKEWRQLEHGPAYAEESGRKLEQIWTIVPPTAGGHWLVGVAEAGLFQSADGETYTPVAGLNDHATREAWYPGAGGLCAHHVLVDPTNAQRIWVGISAVGVFRSDDGGASFAVKTSGLPIIIKDEKHAEVGSCVHSLTLDPAQPDHLWQQNHKGMFRSRDGGDSWERIENGLPAWFGFPLRRDPRTGALFSIPQESDEYRMPIDGELSVYRSDDGGDTWVAKRSGLPDHHYQGVLRGAMAVDGLDPCGVYFGTTAGTLHASADRGETWTTLPCTLPRILSVEAYEE